MKLEALFEATLNDLKVEVLQKARDIAAKTDIVFKTGSGAFRPGKDGVWFSVGLGNSKDYNPDEALEDSVRYKHFAIQMAKMLGEYADKGSEIRIGKGLSPANTAVKKEDIKDAILNGIKNDYVGGMRTGDFMPSISWYVGGAGDFDANLKYFSVSCYYTIHRDKPTVRYREKVYDQLMSLEVGTLTSDKALIKTFEELMNKINKHNPHTDAQEVLNRPENEKLLDYFFELFNIDRSSLKLWQRKIWGTDKPDLNYFHLSSRGPAKSYSKTAKIIPNHEFEVFARALEAAL